MVTNKVRNNCQSWKVRDATARMDNFEIMDVDDMEVIEPQTPIQKFYCNSNVFVTGGTGFVGRLLIQKLLKACPDIVNIYVLIRSKYGKKPHERINNLLRAPIFLSIKEKDPNVLKKVVLIAGDCTLPGLGISNHDKNLLLKNVNIVFHAAANMRFTEKLKASTAVNVIGTYEVLKLCKAMTNLKSVVHVSTAYSHCKRNVISERFFESPADPKKLMDLAKNLNDDLMESLAKRFLIHHPNTYTFTKAVAEELVLQFGKTLPIAIIRPSMIISAYKEPHRGYVTSFYGPTSIITASSCGLLRSIHCDSDKTANVVPADMCVNAMIAITVDVDKAFNSWSKEYEFETPIYHFESSRDQRINWGEYINKAVHNGFMWPTMRAVWYYSLILEKNYLNHLLMMALFHFLPGLFGDFLIIIVGRVPWLTKSMKALYKFTRDFSYFATRDFVFVSKKMHYMIDRMSPEDQNLFFCDLRKLHWDEYFETYFLGMRLFLLRDPVRTLAAARIKYKRLEMMSQMCKILMVFAVMFFTYYVTLKIHFIRF